MTHDTEPITSLLDKLGRMSGRGFCMRRHGQPSDVQTFGTEATAALTALAASTHGTHEVQHTGNGSGERMYGVAVDTARGNELLVSYPYPRQTREAPRDDGSWLEEILKDAKLLIEERDQTRCEARKLTEELNRSYEDLYLFSRIATQIKSLHFSEGMLRDLLEETREAMRVELATACFPHAKGFNVQAASPEFARRLPDMDGFVRALVETIPRSAPAFEKQSFIVTDSREIPALKAMHALPFRALAIEIRTTDRAYGWLLLVSFNMKEIFRRGEYRLLSTMTQQIALVMANTDLYRDLELFVISLVHSLVKALEAKDLYTRGHSERVSSLCMRIANTIGLDAEQRLDLERASMLHDLGKIGTPEALLNKPGRLTDTEFETVQAHPVKGAEILKPVSQLAGALPGIRHHHERYDGKGYPDNLKGDAIPLLARIIAVADSYDAITSDRAYRPGRTHDEAMRIIDDCAGTQLDPAIVQAFQRMFDTHAPVGAPVDTPSGGKPQSLENVTVERPSA